MVAGSDAVVILRAGALIVIDRAWAAVAATLSVTVTVKVDVPRAVGVPEITPVPAARLSPAGNEPELIDQL